MINAKKITDLFVEDYLQIVEKGRKDNIPEGKIEEVQEEYVAFLIRMILKVSGIPVSKKREILQIVEKKLITDSFKMRKKHKFSDTWKRIQQIAKEAEKK